MSHDRPTPAELAEAVREFLEREILPALDDHRLRFRTIVAINGLGILQRQLEASPAGPGEPAARHVAMPEVQVRSAPSPPCRRALPTLP